VANVALTVNFTGPEEQDTTERDPDAPETREDWVHLEQRDTGKGTNKVTLADMYQMHAYARAGRSAYDYLEETCPYVKRAKNGDVEITLEFFAWPSRSDLNYSINSSSGILSAREVVTEQRNIDVVFDGGKTAAMPFVFAGPLVPQMPFINPDGEIITPTLTIDGATALLSEEATGVLRGTGTATGHKYRVTITMPCVESEEDINLEITITATWAGGDKEPDKEELNLEIPECVSAILGRCASGSGKTDGVDDEGNNRRYRVYYSTCDGSILRDGWYDNGE